MNELIFNLQKSKVLRKLDLSENPEEKEADSCTEWQITQKCSVLMESDILNKHEENYTQNWNTINFQV